MKRRKIDRKLGCAGSLGRSRSRSAQDEDESVFRTHALRQRKPQSITSSAKPAACLELSGQEQSEDRGRSVPRPNDPSLRDPKYSSPCEAGVGDVFQVSIRRDRLERQDIDDFESREGDLTLAWQSKTFTVFQRSQSREIVHDDR